MKNTLARKTAYIGAGAGLVLFALFGLLPGSLLGGAAGINIAGWLFGLPLNPGLLSRIIVLAFMLIGVLVSGIVIVDIVFSFSFYLRACLSRADPAGKRDTLPRVLARVGYAFIKRRPLK